MSLGALEYQAFDEDQAQVAKAAFNVFSADPFATDAGRSAGWFAVGIPEELGERADRRSTSRPSWSPAEPRWPPPRCRCPRG